MSDTDAITVYSDYVCPFCYLGRQSLAEYQESREDRLDVDWRPFDLRAGKRGPDGGSTTTPTTGRTRRTSSRPDRTSSVSKEQYGADG